MLSKTGILTLGKYFFKSDLFSLTKQAFEANISQTRHEKPSLACIWLIFMPIFDELYTS